MLELQAKFGGDPHGGGRRKESFSAYLCVNFVYAICSDLCDAVMATPSLSSFILFYCLLLL